MFKTLLGLLSTASSNIVPQACLQDDGVSYLRNRLAIVSSYKATRGGI
jgi:hypothetical protein